MTIGLRSLRDRRNGRLQEPAASLHVGPPGAPAPRTLTYLRGTILTVLAILFLAPTESAAAQQRQQRFPEAYQSAPDFTAPVPARIGVPQAEILTADEDEVFYTPGRIVLSILGILCGPVGALAALESGFDGPWDRVANLGALVGVTTCGTAGLLIPGPTPPSAVTPTLVGAVGGLAAGAALVFSGEYPLEIIGPLLGVVGAHAGFAWAAFSDPPER